MVNKFKKTLRKKGAGEGEGEYPKDCGQGQTYKRIPNCPFTYLCY